MTAYIHQHTNWRHFTWQSERIALLLGKVRNMQGQILGKMQMLGFELQDEAVLATLTLNILKSTEIEGEFLNAEQVRSSLARRLGIPISGVLHSERHVEGIVEMMLDATQQYQQPLTAERLCNWHAALFPTGRSGMYKITVGNWRNDATGAMQVVSGGIGREKVHFQAPAAAVLEEEMAAFLAWFNQPDDLDPVIKAAILHLWFITIHPFDDGNGRIARAVADMQLCKADLTTQRFYSMAAQIQLQRNAYYDTLESTQKGTMDITNWLLWFLDCLASAIVASDFTLEKVLYKANFWQKNAHITLNTRQKLMLNKLLDGFEGKLTSSKWSKITKCSPDTALRDVQDLIEKRILQKDEAGGRSTNYELL
jgi:Fic family protein